MKTVKYIRISTASQNTARQENTELKNYIDVCSGIVAFKERKEAKKLLKDVEQGKVKQINVHSIDRLGRNAKDIQDTIFYFAELGVNIFAEDLGMNSLLKDKLNPMFKLVTDLLANVAQLERDSIRQRQKEGIAIAKAKGVYKKAKHRQPLTEKQLIQKNKAILNCLETGMSLNKTAEATGKSIPTIIKVKKAIAALAKEQQTFSVIE